MRTGPVFYRQLRVGRALADRTDLFELIKFRTMRSDAEAGGAAWAKKGDSRITRVGMFLRKTRLDELPQAINILKGEMSLIGPRPERPVFFLATGRVYPALYRENLWHSSRRYRPCPGQSGL
ncbi:MAG: sugar transferase [Nitratireductor sp.]